VEYGFYEAKTTYGVLGVKVWIYKGEVFDLYASDGDARQNPANAG
jgi:small subunit ribosomal protein S3